MAPLTFNLGGLPGDLHFIVRVFDTKAEMNAHYIQFCRDAGKTPDGDTLEAVVMPYERRKIGKNGSETRLSDIGEALFYRGRMDEQTVAQQLLFCAGHASSLEGFGDADPLELREDMTRDFYRHFAN